jgi:peptide-methionine (R)-S-oxide reductase
MPPHNNTRDPALDPALDPQRLPSDAWEKILNPLEYQILRHSATERAGTGRYLDLDAPGAYHCAGCGQRLYDASHKFHSGCGWPSFFQEVEPGALKTIRDTSHGMVRVEMRCARCDGHLGHIFQDAPHTPTGTRHCVNGASLLFVPRGADPRAVFAAHRASTQTKP